MPRAVLAVIAAAMSIAAPSAMAQEAVDDWDLTIDEAQDVMLATVGYSSGQALAVRCRAGELDVLISGLPPLEGPSRRIEAIYPDGRDEVGSWFAGGDGSLVFSPAPRLDARRFRQGGSLQMSVAIRAAPDAAPRQYALDLPAQFSNLDRVLQACGADQPDARADLVRWNQPLIVGDLWRRLPAPQYPEAAAHLGAGFVTVSCVVGQGGRLTDCRIERESHARRYGFGEAALSSMRDARIAPPEEGGPQPGQVFLGTIRFSLAP
ncbi:TonB family protein [Brevundimonas sp.]|uniref:TonB family protein n=1 Tax=Brevundimonas sp. TaxID=1871086 RepID=UPI002D763766|nr:TonB family protein [Brevundimonas sp.]HYC67334.1 TonB family protein [Brevundimonas sp.]